MLLLFGLTVIAAGAWLVINGHAVGKLVLGYGVCLVLVFCLSRNWKVCSFGLA
jgi:hypothetical protein